MRRSEGSGSKDEAKKAAAETDGETTLFLAWGQETPAKFARSLFAAVGEDCKGLDFQKLLESRRGLDFPKLRESRKS